MSKSYSMYFVLKDIINTQNMDSIYSHTLNCINGTPAQKIQAFGSTPEKAFKHLKTQSEYHAYGISWIEGTKKKKRKSDGLFYYPKVKSFHYLGLVKDVVKSLNT